MNTYSIDQFVYIADRPDYAPGPNHTEFLMVWRSHWFLHEWMFTKSSDKHLLSRMFIGNIVELNKADLELYDQDRLTAKLQGRYNNMNQNARDNKFIQSAQYCLAQGRRVFYFSEESNAYE